MIQIKPDEAREFHTALLKELEDGVVHFKYEKKDGTMRWAFGTKKPDIIPVSKDIGEKYAKLLHTTADFVQKYDEFCGVDAGGGRGTQEWNEADDARDIAFGFLKLEMPKPRKASTPREPNPDMIMYWDFEAGAVRNFNIEQLRGVYVPENKKGAKIGEI